MFIRPRLLPLALALAVPAPLLAQAAPDFSLPPAPAPSATPRAQGPVDEESGPVPIRPRAIRTATPAPSPVPTPSATQAPAAVPTPRASSVTPRVTPTAVPRPSPAVTPTRAPAPEEAPVASPSPTVVPSAAPRETPALPATSAPIAAPTAAAPAAAAPVAKGDGDWSWLAMLGAALLVLLGAGWMRQRRRAAAPPPVIERPVVRAAGDPAAPVLAGVAAADLLAIRCEAEKLTRSAMFATLKYRLTLINRTDAPLTDVAIGLDLVSAHANAPMEEQIATAGTALDTKHTLARIAPRQTLAVEGQVQLPLSAAHVILQGRHPLLVPLLRVRVDGAGEGALVKTFVVGQGLANGGRVQPFPLDEPPRSYAPLAHRELA